MLSSILNFFLQILTNSCFFFRFALTTDLLVVEQLKWAKMVKTSYNSVFMAHATFCNALVWIAKKNILGQCTSF